MGVIYLMLIHFIADSLLQSREMGRKKSEYPAWLARHILIILLSFTVLSVPIFGLTLNLFLFATLNAIIHAAIDWNIWRIYKITAIKKIRREKIKPSQFEYWNDPNFYHTIMLDQLLHYATIVVLYNGLCYGG